MTTKEECHDLLMNFYNQRDTFNTNEKKKEGLRWFNVLTGSNETTWGCKNTWMTVETILGRYYQNKK